jgi:hypothetical protein
MARYKEYSYEQTKLIAIAFSHQILPGAFEYTLNYLIDNEFDLSPFEQRYGNDETRAPAYGPVILLKIIKLHRLGYLGKNRQSLQPKDSPWHVRSTMLRKSA